MKIFINNENEKFLEVKTKFGVFYRSYTTGFYYEHKTDKMVIANNSLNDKVFDNMAYANGFSTIRTLNSIDL